MKRSSSGNKKTSSWIAPSFGDFEKTSITKSKVDSPKKQKKTSKNVIDLTDDQPINGESQEEYIPWIDLYSPTDELELAVNKKKVQEVKDWLQNTQSQVKGNGGILLLSGPSGCGKSAVIHVLSKTLGYELKEWVNPVSYDYQENTGDSWRDYSTWNISQTQQFKDFLLRANRYNGLSMLGQVNKVMDKKIVLVEDFPNFILRDPTKLHGILRQYLHTCRSPLVFIISDTHTSDATVHKIFSNNIQQELNISHISFNGASVTSLKSMMNRLIKLEAVKNENLLIPSKDTMDLLIESGGGDIRSSINAIQFYCTNCQPYIKPVHGKSIRSKATTRIKPSKTTAKKLSKSVKYGETVVVGGRDNSLFLFRSLGKVLYCKRGPLSAEEKCSQLPLHLKHHARDRMLENPENVFERTQITSDTFMLYLHQNYPGFYSNIDDLSSASLYMSDADICSSAWDNRHVMSDYCSSISMRGVMFANNSATKSTKGSVAGGWRPLHKPEYFQAYKRTNTRKLVGRTYFKEYSYPSHDLFSEVLPYMGKIIRSSLPQAHKSFITELNSYTGMQRNYRPQLQVLNDGTDLNSSMTESSMDGFTNLRVTEEDSNSTNFINDEMNELDSIEDFEDD